VRFIEVRDDGPTAHSRPIGDFERAFDDPVFWRSLSNTFVFTAVSMALIVVLGKVQLRSPMKS
jgi:multiple sugar transport system permease protein